ncbi:MAG: hypothetical protein J0L92_35295, partial [Deltaproteobacteria bacterium]|nr:hypothetical protein [Deltaproteobacteria bacterium]
FTAAGTLNKARHKHAAVRIGDAVLLLGGAGPREYEAQYADSEVWREGRARTETALDRAESTARAQRRQLLDAIEAMRPYVE